MISLPTIDLYTIFVILHLLGMGFGIVGATVSDLLFFRSIKDGKIEKHELDVMNFVSRFIWVGLIVAIISGIGFLYLYISKDMTTVVSSGVVEKISNPKIWAKITIVALIALNGILIHIKILPIFKKSINKSIKNSDISKNLTLILTSGALSVTSWYTVFLMGAWSGLNFHFSYFEFIGIYLLLILFAIVTSNVLGRMHLKK